MVERIMKTINDYKIGLERAELILVLNKRKNKSKIHIVNFLCGTLKNMYNNEKIIRAPPSSKKDVPRTNSTHIAYDSFDDIPKEYSKVRFCKHCKQRQQKLS